MNVQVQGRPSGVVYQALPKFRYDRNSPLGLLFTISVITLFFGVPMTMVRSAAAWHVQGKWRRNFGPVAAHAGPATQMDSVPQESSQSIENRVKPVLPWLTDPEMLAENVVYEGMLESFEGRDEYIKTMVGWRDDIPSRLQDFRIVDKESWTLQPGEVTCRWSCKFVASLPPPARLRGLPPNLTVLPFEKVEVGIGLKSTLTLNSDGRIARHTEEITSGFEMADAIARYELLTARRRDEDPVSWYWRVLRATTMEEINFYTGGRLSQEELEVGFFQQVARSAALGTVIALLLYILRKFANTFHWP